MKLQTRNFVLNTFLSEEKAKKTLEKYVASRNKNLKLFQKCSHQIQGVNGEYYFPVNTNLRNFFCFKLEGVKINVESIPIYFEGINFGIVQDIREYTLTKSLIGRISNLETENKILLNTQIRIESDNTFIKKLLSETSSQLEVIKDENDELKRQMLDFFTENCNDLIKNDDNKLERYNLLQSIFFDVRSRPVIIESSLLPTSKKIKKKDISRLDRFIKVVTKLNIGKCDWDIIVNRHEIIQKITDAIYNEPDLMEGLPSFIKKYSNSIFL